MLWGKCVGIKTFHALITRGCQSQANESSLHYKYTIYFNYIHILLAPFSLSRIPLNTPSPQLHVTDTHIHICVCDEGYVTISPIQYEHELLTMSQLNTQSS